MAPHRAAGALPLALEVPSQTMSPQTAIRIWCVRSGISGESKPLGAVHFFFAPFPMWRSFLSHFLFLLFSILL